MRASEKRGPLVEGEACVVLVVAAGEDHILGVVEGDGNAAEGN